MRVLQGRPGDGGGTRPQHADCGVDLTVRQTGEWPDEVMKGDAGRREDAWIACADRGPAKRWEDARRRRRGSPGRRGTRCRSEGVPARGDGGRRLRYLRSTRHWPRSRGSGGGAGVGARGKGSGCPFPRGAIRRAPRGREGSPRRGGHWTFRRRRRGWCRGPRGNGPWRWAASGRASRTEAGEFWRGVARAVV